MEMFEREKTVLNVEAGMLTECCTQLHSGENYFYTQRRSRLPSTPVEVKKSLTWTRLGKSQLVSPRNWFQLLMFSQVFFPR